MVSDRGKLESVATLQAGEVIGEMAIVTGSKKRNASVVASSPVSVCVFSEATFNAFISDKGYKTHLLKRWRLRQQIRHLPQFHGLISTVLERIAHLAACFYPSMKPIGIYSHRGKPFLTMKKI